MMKFSIITPTHKPKYISDLYDSVAEQTYENWELIISLNGEASVDMIDDRIKNDPRVVVYRDDQNVDTIGAIKHDAFFRGTGDILVELDHDDMLTPDCLEKLKDVFENHPNVGFVYSDDVKLTENFTPYRADRGWSWRNVEWKGHDYIAMHAFEPCSQSLSAIYWAPNHVRAWRKNVYLSIGGHDKSLKILDDHDLMCRTYIQTDFFHIPEVLYVYRIDGENSWLKYANTDIPKLTIDIFEKYGKTMAERDCEKKDLLKVQLVFNSWIKKDGYVTLGIGEGVDIEWDFVKNKKIPLEDNSVGIVDASHVFQKHPDSIFLMKEIYRVCDDFAWVFTEVPSTTGYGAFSDPTHKTFWNKDSFSYYTDPDVGKYAGTDKIRFQKFFEKEVTKNFSGRMIACCEVWMSAVKTSKNRCGENKYVLS